MTWKHNSVRKRQQN